MSVFVRLDKICFGEANWVGLYTRYDYRNKKWKEIAKGVKRN